MKSINRNNVTGNRAHKRKNFCLSNIKRLIQTVAHYEAYRDGHNDIDRLFTEMNSLKEEFESDYISWNIARIITNFTIHMKEADRIIKAHHESREAVDAAKSQRVLKLGKPQSLAL